MDGKFREKAWRAGLDVAYDGLPNAANPHPVDSEPAKYRADGWLESERLFWMRQVLSHTSY